MPVTPVAPTALTPLAEPLRAAASAPTEGPFAKVFNELLARANGEQTRADRAVLDLVAGRTDNVHDVTLAVSRADLAFRLILEIRNRLTEAYQEVARMQI